MKAEDTVIQLKALPTKIFESKDDTIDIKMAYVAGWKDGTEAQAEITWAARQPEIDEAEKAGIKKVVEWIDGGYSEIHHVPEAGGECVCIYLEGWEHQLKEWGL